MDFATHVPINHPVRIPDRISISCRIEHAVSDVVYGDCAYPSSIHDKRTTGITHRVGNPIAGVGARPVELIAKGCPTPNVFFGGVTAARGISLPNLF